jgi:hypothetical protein
MADELKPWCDTCGKTVQEVLCPTCAKWWADNPPPSPDPSAPLVETLRWYGEQFCELGGFIEPCGHLSDNDCAGCKARQALAQWEKDNG